MTRTRSQPQDANDHTSTPFFRRKAARSDNPQFFDGHQPPALQRKAESEVPSELEDETPLQAKAPPQTIQRASAEEESNQEAALGLQAKLRVGQAEDQYEQEADRVADDVVDQLRTPEAPSRPGSFSRTPPQISPLVMRQGEGAVAATPRAEQGINRTRGGGERMAANVRRDMEQAMGADFSGVKIHNDSEADSLNRSLNARAFTTGEDIYFRHGEYHPESLDGQRLLAHELTHVAQQGGAKQLIQADFAVAPTTPGTAVRTLSQAEIQAAIAFNQGIYTNATQVSHLRDVLGISPAPATIDAAFVNAVARYQAQYGLTQDGRLDLASANALARELNAESDFINSGRSTRITTRGAVQHTGPVRAPPAGAQGPAVGNVEVRTGETVELAPGSTVPNVIALEYSGALLPDSRWLQFVWFEMTAATPAGTGQLSGSLRTTSGVLPFTTTPAAPTWAVDSGTNNPFYESDAVALRNSSSTTIFDAPGGATVAPLAAAVFGAGIGATSATFTAHFETYLIQNNQAFYVVPYSASTTFTPPAVAGGAPVGGAITYAVGAAGTVAALPANLRTLLHARYPLFRNIR